MSQNTLRSDDFCYIIDHYSKFHTNSNVIKTFHLYVGGKNLPYCIRKIPVKSYNWGVPELNDWEEQDFEQDYSQQHAYSTLEEAEEYVYFLKRYNG